MLNSNSDDHNASQSQKSISKAKLPAWGWVFIFLLALGMFWSGYSLGQASPETRTLESIDDTTKMNSVDSAKLHLIPAGEFQMGSVPSAGDPQEIHPVYLDDFWMYETEVTNQMYAKFLNATKPDNETLEDYIDTEDSDLQIEKSGRMYHAIEPFVDYPMIEVSWTGAQAYCEWAGGSLPTEAQWEKAARGGLESKEFPWGDQYPSCNTEDIHGALISDCGQQSITVGSFSPNGYGLYDMVGNVWEWVADWYSYDYYGISPYENPTGPQGGRFRVLRGGSWYYDLFGGRVSHRYNFNPGSTFNYFGFRCAQNH